MDRRGVNRAPDTAAAGGPFASFVIGPAAREDREIIADRGRVLPHAAAGHPRPSATGAVRAAFFVFNPAPDPVQRGMPSLDEIVAYCDRRTRRAAFKDFPGAVNGRARA